MCVDYASMLTMWFFYGLDYAFANAASMIHLWATIRGKSFPVTNSLSMIPMLLPMAWTMLPLVLLYGCFYGLDYVVLLWSELCVCLCLLL
jgi:hypothetical protein